MVGLERLELSTSRLSGVRSSHLSYRPPDVFFSKSMALSPCSLQVKSELGIFPIKEVIQPQVPLRLPCYDFIPVTSLTLGPCLLAVGFRYFGCDRLP